MLWGAGWGRPKTRKCGEDHDAHSPPRNSCHPEAEGRGTFTGPGKVPRCARDDSGTVMAASSNNPPLLEVKNLRVEFPTRRGTLLAVDHVSVDIAPGEAFGVVGESGARKALTRNAIIRLPQPPSRI